jgi:hypothetical protein
MYSNNLGHVRNLWATSLFLAHKFLDDKHFANATYASVNQMCLKELNRLERECLRLLDFTLMVKEEEFLTFKKELQEIVLLTIEGLSAPMIPNRDCRS